MSRSKKWRLEWSFFLGENGRRRYNKICKGCIHPCKQSFRAVLIACPHYQSARSKKCGAVLMISHVGLPLQFKGCREAVLNTFP